MAISTRPVEGVVEYKRTPMQQKVVDVLTKPTSLAVLAPLVPKGVSLDEVGIEVYRAVTKVPSILECTDESIIMAVADCLSVGLRIGKEIHLVPVNNTQKNCKELQAWTDYKGDIALVVAAGGARMVEAHAIYEADRFEPHLGTDPHIVHIPEYLKPRGKMIGAYAVATITQSIKKVCVMRLDEIEAIRKNSRKWGPKNVADCPDWYACKTTIHRITKDLPKNAKLSRILAMFERQDEVEHGAGDPDLAPERRVDPAATVRHAVDPASESAANGSDYSVEDATSESSTSQESAAPAAADDQPNCPKCGGAMWDNRAKKASGQFKPNAPDFACKDRPHCDGKIWPPKDDEQDGLQF